MLGITSVRKTCDYPRAPLIWVGAAGCNIHHNPSRTLPTRAEFNTTPSDCRSTQCDAQGAIVVGTEASKGPWLSRFRTSTSHGVLVALAATLLLGTLGGCTSTRQRDFYAARNIDITPTPGDGTVIVRSNAVDLLTRERQALALSRKE